MPAAPRLHELQQGFVDALLGRGDAVAAWVDGAGLDPSARLRIYQHAVAATLTAALHDSYPTVHALVGEAFFEMLAARYQQQHPSACGNLQQFGGALPGFIESMPEAQPLGYLADIAKLDWLRQVAALAPDATPVDSVAIAAAAMIDSHRLHVCLQKSLQWMNSQYPLLTLWQWCQSPSGVAPSLDQGSESVLLWRDGNDVAMATVAPATLRCLEVLQAGCDVTSAYLAATDVDPQFDLEPCMRDLLVQGLIVAFTDQERAT